MDKHKGQTVSNMAALVLSAGSVSTKGAPEKKQWWTSGRKQETKTHWETKAGPCGWIKHTIVEDVDAVLIEKCLSKKDASVHQ